MDSTSDDVKEMPLLLLSYFDEEEESMFVHAEDTRLAEEVEVEPVPLTPTITFCYIFVFRMCHVSGALNNTTY